MPEPDCEGWVEDRSRPEGVTDEDEALGRERFQRGVTAFREGHYAAARFEFLWAYELTRRAALLYNASLAMDRLGQQQEAEATIHRLYGELDPCHPIARELRMRGYHPPP